MLLKRWKKLSEVVTYEAIRKGEKISPELLVKYVELKLEVLDLWIKKLKQFFVQVEMALSLLEKQNYDTNMLLLKLEKRREELERL
jgi:hypothetical protein